jgi:hypothetical protein
LLRPIAAESIFAEVHLFFEQHGYRHFSVLPQYKRSLDQRFWQVGASSLHEASLLLASTIWA